MNVEYLGGRARREQPFTLNMDGNAHTEFLSLDIGPVPIIVTTSSLLQAARCCTNLTYLDLSFTVITLDTYFKETGQYLSSMRLPCSSNGGREGQESLTGVSISVQMMIEEIGKSCPKLEEVKMKGCEWVTAHTIYLWVTHCPNLMRLDARQASKCVVKPLVSSILTAYDDDPGEENNDLPDILDVLPYHIRADIYQGIYERYTRMVEGPYLDGFEDIRHICKLLVIGLVPLN